jgi:hypothetical protein
MDSSSSWDPPMFHTAVTTKPDRILPITIWEWRVIMTP